MTSGFKKDARIAAAVLRGPGAVVVAS